MLVELLLYPAHDIQDWFVRPSGNEEWSSYPDPVTILIIYTQNLTQNPSEHLQSPGDGGPDTLAWITQGQGRVLSTAT